MFIAKSKAKKEKVGNGQNSNGTVTWDKKTKTEMHKKTRQSEMKMALQQTKGSMNAENMYSIVVLPNRPVDYEENYNEEREEIHEWWAENIVDFYNELTCIHGICTEKNGEWEDICRHPERFENSGYPKGVKYLWKANKDGEAKLLPLDIYMDHIIVWVNSQMENEEVFPTDEDVPFSNDFKMYAKKIMKRMFRMFAIFYTHPVLYTHKDVKGQLELCFKHFMYFAWKWELLDNNETKCIQKFTAPLKGKFTRDAQLYKQGKLPKGPEPALATA